MISSSKAIVPLLNKVVIKKVVAPKSAAKQLSQTSSGLYIPESQRIKSAGTGNFSKGQIVSISEQLKEKSILKTGDLVLYPSHLEQLTSVKTEAEGDNAEQILLINLDDLVAKVSN
ncbi:hypothetical protein QEN19_001127 [Hanseniaspora menglaensis]